MKKSILIIAMIFIANCLFSQENSQAFISSFEIEVNFDKTSHLIFPSNIRYSDLGSPNIIGGKAMTVNNVYRVKAAIRDFEGETNFSVITDEGTFYSFRVTYSDEPKQLNYDVEELVRKSQGQSNVNNQSDIYLEELGAKSNKLVELIMYSIFNQDRRTIKHIGDKGFGMQSTLHSMYTHDDMMYFNIHLNNTSSITYEIDFIRFRIVNKQVVKRVAMQETTIAPVKIVNHVSSVPSNRIEKMVFAFDVFTIPPEKQLIVEIYEKGGGRNYSFSLDNSDLLLARRVDGLKF